MKTLITKQFKENVLTISKFNAIKMLSKNIEGKLNIEFSYRNEYGFWETTYGQLTDWDLVKLKKKVPSLYVTCITNKY